MKAKKVPAVTGKTKKLYTGPKKPLNKEVTKPPHTSIPSTVARMK